MQAAAKPNSLIGSFLSFTVMNTNRDKSIASVSKQAKLFIYKVIGHSNARSISTLCMLISQQHKDSNTTV